MNSNYNTEQQNMSYLTSYLPTFAQLSAKNVRKLCTFEY